MAEPIKSIPEQQLYGPALGACSAAAAWRDDASSWLAPASAAPSMPCLPWAMAVQCRCCLREKVPPWRAPTSIPLRHKAPSTGSVAKVAARYRSRPTCPTRCRLPAW